MHREGAGPAPEKVCTMGCGHQRSQGLEGDRTHSTSQKPGARPQRFPPLGEQIAAFDSSGAMRWIQEKCYPSNHCVIVFLCLNPLSPYKKLQAWAELLKDSFKTKPCRLERVLQECRVHRWLLGHRSSKQSPAGLPRSKPRDSRSLTQHSSHLSISP